LPTHFLSLDRFSVGYYEFTIISDFLCDARDVPYEVDLRRLQRLSVDHPLHNHQRAQARHFGVHILCLTLVGIAVQISMSSCREVLYALGAREQFAQLNELTTVALDR